MNDVKIYCAGPLFNPKEKEEMAEIAGALESCGLQTFLPQRDGLELSRCLEVLVSRGIPFETAKARMCSAVFALDVYQLLFQCNALVANLNGRVPDDGTVAEAAMAWSRGRPVFGYKSDTRTAFAGTDNPLVAGLFEFTLHDSVGALVDAVRRALPAIMAPEARKKLAHETKLSHAITLGQRIAEQLRVTRDPAHIADILVSEPAGRTHG